MKKANVFYSNILAGQLIEEEDGFYFYYLEDYLNRSDAKPVSLTLPLTAAPYFKEQLFPFFDGLIPEGWILDLALKKWNISPTDRMTILMKTGTNVIGNVSVEEAKDE